MAMAFGVAAGGGGSAAAGADHAALFSVIVYHAEQIKSADDFLLW